MAAAAGDASVGVEPNAENKLFIGGCPPSSSEDDLRKLFEEHGKVEEVFIMRGGSRSGMACAFVRYTTREMAQAAIEGIHGQHRLPDATEPLVVRWADAPGSRKRDAREASKRRGGGAGVGAGGRGRGAGGSVGGSQMGNFFCGMNYAALNLAMQQMMMQQQQQQGGMGSAMGAMPGSMPFFQPQQSALPPAGNFSGGMMPPQMMGFVPQMIAMMPQGMQVQGGQGLLNGHWMGSGPPSPSHLQQQMFFPQMVSMPQWSEGMGNGSMPPSGGNGMRPSGAGPPDSLSM